MISESIAEKLPERHIIYRQDIRMLIAGKILMGNIRQRNPEHQVWQVECMKLKWRSCSHRKAVVLARDRVSTEDFD